MGALRQFSIRPLLLTPRQRFQEWQLLVDPLALRESCRTLMKQMQDERDPTNLPFLATQITYGIQSLDVDFARNAFESFLEYLERAEYSSCRYHMLLGITHALLRLSSDEAVRGWRAFVPILLRSDYHYDYLADDVIGALYSFLDSDEQVNAWRDIKDLFRADDYSQHSHVVRAMRTIIHRELSLDIIEVMIRDLLECL